MADAADQANAALERAMDRYQSARPPDTWTSPREQGECADCGDSIEPERLRIHPFAVRCVECQQFYEEAMTRG